MHRLFFSLFVLLASINFNSIYAQEIFDAIKTNFQSFEYHNVITLANKAIDSNLITSKDTLIEVYRMKAISHYALKDERLAEKSFREILKLKLEFELDTLQTSPKIVAFFRMVKNDYKKELLRSETTQAKDKDSTASILLQRNILIEKIESNYKNSVTRSLIFPGWGQLYLGQTTKGLILLSSAIVSYSGLVYSIIETNKREKQYLNEIDESLIPQRYKEYNNSYKLRNVFIISSALIWVFSQFDLLFFDSMKFVNGESLTTNLKFISLPNSLSFNFNIAF
ncbi:MAG: hypothetical protein N3A61_04575 [Ignavibacteria bacterium]|nr:hypothetical protein [Ignavibacteria bacterium]